MKKRSRRKLLFFSLTVVAVLAIASVFICNAVIMSSAKGKLYSEISQLPYRKVGLLLGTGKFLADGRINLYYQYRIEAAAELIKKSKIKYLVISGDNSRKDYNEPQMMKEDLVKAGVDSSRIYLDYAGFRTFDSMVRLKDIFGQDEVTVISQKFHNERAIYLASKTGVSAIGFNAKDVSNSAGWKVRAREKLARVKVFLDLLFRKKPKFLGEKVELPEE